MRDVKVSGSRGGGGIIQLFPSSSSGPLVGRAGL